ncbi:MAG TPA: hypothetical protein VFV52_16715 [Bacilli bacterium]|nr:hypothetical protein [Bacilli bacterium]
MRKNEAVERLLWSIAFPGFGQLLNGKLLKGALFVALEFLINMYSHLNLAIIHSFRGEIQGAIQEIDYQWLLFYPCVYLFAIWDAYRDAGGGTRAFAFLPFVCSAYLGTVGVVFSASLKVMGVLLGPVWLPILFLWIGGAVGVALRLVIHRLV